MNKKITFLTLCLWLTAATFPVFAQQESDTDYTFRFVSQEDMFFVPWSNNGKELARLLECVESNKTDILNGKMPVFVDGYCNSLGSDAENLAVAKIRSNRVKSELIIRQGLNEDCFTTHNHASGGDYVTVRIVVPAKESAVTDAEAEARRRAEAERLEAEKRAEQERLAAERRKAEEAQAEAERMAEAVSTAEEETAKQERLAAEKAEAEKRRKEEARLAAAQAEADSYSLSLRANLLRWATLTPDVGIEWRVSPTVGIVVNGSWTTWTWNDNDRRYALWEVMPELRFYLGEKKAWYMGAMFKTGQFNYKLSNIGRLGDLMGGGLTGGYQLRLSNALSLDFSLALGYLQADYETYEVTNTVRIYTGEGTQNWWGPINAGVTLVWKLF